MAVLSFALRASQAETPEPPVPAPGSAAGVKDGAASTAAPAPDKSEHGKEERQGMFALSDVLNILLIGSDGLNPNDSSLANADGILLVTLNPGTRELIFTSFLRDTRVRVKDAYYDKLTSVYHEGGVELLREAIEDNFGIHTDYYALFTYQDVIDLVDLLGGVTLDLSFEEIAFMDPKIWSLSHLTGTDYKENAISVDQAGTLTLNGVQAAAYIRIRPDEGHYDVGRTARARKLVSLILQKFAHADTGELLSFGKAFYRRLDNDIPNLLVVRLGMNLSDLRGYQLVYDRIPIDGSYDSGNSGMGYFVYPDLEVNRQHLQDSLYEGIHP